MMMKIALAIVGVVALGAIALEVDTRSSPGFTSSGRAPLTPGLPATRSGWVPPTPGLPAPLTVYNSSGSAVTSVPVSYEQPFARGNVPSGYHAVVYSGTTPLTTQQDACSTWAQDGSCKSTQLSFVVSSISGSGNTAYTVQAVAGAPSTTSNISTAQATGNTNICVKTSELQRADGTAETGTWRLACLNDIIANYSQFNSNTGYGTNPTGGWEYYSQGPVKIGIHAWQFAKRESDRAMHKWLRTDLWVDMRGSGTKPCPCSVAYLTSEPNIYGGVAAGTIGGTTEPGYIFSTTVLNGSNVIHYFGGAGDSRTGTIANVKFKTSNSQIDISGTWLTKTYGSGPVKFTCATTCPTGITAGVAYWPGSVDATHIQLYRYQCMLTNGCNTSGNTPVSITSQGSGTITMTPYTFTNPYSGYLGLDSDANRLWISAAGTATTAPPVLIGHDFTYLSQKTKATPPYITALAGKLLDYASTHPIYDYYPGSYQYAADLNSTGDAPGDERVSYIDHTGTYSLFNPADAAAAKASRVFAAGFARGEMYNIDEKSGQPVVFNNGHAKNGTTYAAMGAVQPSARTYPNLNKSWMVPYTGDADRTYIIWRYSVRLDGSHLPVPFQAPLLKSGNPEWEFAMINEANAVLGQGNHTSNTQGPTTYYRPLGQNEQTRGIAWGIRAVAQANYFVRDNNPASQYLKDMLQDEVGWLNAINTHYMNSRATSLGYLFSDVAEGNPFFQPWQNDFIYTSLAMEAWRGEYSGFTTWTTYHAKFAVARMDPVRGGCLWAAPARQIQPWLSGIAGDYPNLSQTFTDIYTHTAAKSQGSGNGFDVANGGSYPFSCPARGLISDSPGSYGYQPSSVISFLPTTAAMADILGEPRMKTAYNAIRAMQYGNGCSTCAPAMSFINYNDGHRTFSVPEFAWGYLGATQ
jgi:hypothetical protein